MKSRIRFLVTVLTILTMLFSVSVPGYAGTKDAIRLSIDGQLLDNNAIENEGAVFLPLRSVCESLGYTVEWSQQNRSVTVTGSDKTVIFEPRKDTVTDAGHSFYVTAGYLSGDYIGAGCLLVDQHIYVASGLMQSCFRIKETFDQKSGTLALSVSPKGPVSFENKTIHTEDERLLTTIQYPYFSTDDRAVSDKINAVIKTDVETAQKEAQDNLSDLSAYRSPNKCETYFNYKISYQQGELLSVVIDDYQYFGGAHGSTRRISHTFDLKTGAEYPLADLMKDGSGYKKYINSRIKADIVKDGMADAQLVKFESIAENQSYYLSNKGLVVYFQQYEYFPYAAGIMEYDFSYDSLADYLKPGISL